MRCPGQDMQYWKGDAAFEIACPRCAAAVEFFKDESSRRCKRCGHLFPNPKISLNCAQWCDYAEQCLGSTPSMQRQLLPEAAFAGRLLTAAAGLLGLAQDSGAPALLVFQHARELVAGEPCNPRVALAAALVIELESHGFKASTSDATAPPETPSPLRTPEDVLAQFAMDETDIRDVCEVLDRLRQETVPRDIETRIVRDAIVLAELAVANARGELEKVKYERANGLTTQAGKERAQSLFGC